MPEPAKPADAIDDPIEAAIRKSVQAANEPETEVVDEVADEQPVVETPAVETTATTETTTTAAADAPPVVADDKKPDAAAAAAAVPPVVKKPDEELDISKVPARNAAGKVNSIPQPRVVKMVEKSVEKAKTEWTEKVLKPVQSKVETYETRLHSIASTEDLMFGMRDGKPLPDAEGLAAKKQFLTQLASAVPGYAELLKGANLGLSNTESGVKQPAATENAVVDPNDPEPKPDVVENGVPVGYSEKGLADLRAWDRRQASREAADRAVAELTKRYGLDKMHGAFTSVENKRQSLADIDQQIDVASKTWPGFVENAKEITDALVASTDPRFGLREAYQQVLYGLATRKVTDERTLEETLRVRIADELARAPRSTSAGAGSISTRAAEDVPTTGDPVEDAIRRSIRGLK